AKSVPGPRSRCRGPSDHPPAIEAPPSAGVLPEAAFMSDWHRGLRFVAPLVSPTPGRAGRLPGSRGVPEWNPKGRHEAQVAPSKGFGFHDMIADVFGQFGGVRSRHEMTCVDNR